MQVRHLPRFARVAADATPIGIPDGFSTPRTLREGVITKGLTYRNAAFQALLNTPMFVNFVRAHHRRRRLANKCTVGPSCLACSFTVVSACYWSISLREDLNQLNRAIADLWQLCLNTFWGPDSKAANKIGPLEKDDEYWADSFMLQFLAEMQRQLEISPG